MAEFTFSLPITIPRPRSRDLPLNLNEYRNAHYQTLNNMKIKFKEEVSAIDEIKVLLPKLNRIELHYILYPKTRRACDVANVLSIVDKFFSDALVELGKLEDDSYHFLPKVTYEIGTVDKDNPRADVTIKEI